MAKRQKPTIKNQRHKDFEELTRLTFYFTPLQQKQIKQAWEFVQLAQDDQSSPLAVAKILATWKLDSDSIVAGLLHDTIQAGGAQRTDIVKEFGEKVAQLVDGVTNVAQVRLRAETQEEKFIENVRKMVLFMAKDIRVVLVKLADYLHTLRSLNTKEATEDQRRIAKETLEVYAPLAERLGMGQVKGELEDLSFSYLYPSDYKRINQSVSSYYKQAEANIEKMQHVLLRRLADEGIRGSIHGRKKHLYSLWKKLLRPQINGDFGKVHDIIALRVLLNTVPECYTALGIVHANYKPVPSIGVSDFIAQPKPNGYQSIHTKVFGSHGQIVEVQIRTHKMHEQAEHGIAAHWAYSQAKARAVSSKELEVGVKVTDKLSWVRELVMWQKELTDSKEFLKAVKIDALNSRNFVFSPKGDVFDLPHGATPIDFAFTVHTNLGQFISGAKVNGRMVPLNYKLKSGEVVEIIKSKNPKKPNRDWLDFVVTTMARREILKQLRKVRS